MRRTALRRSSIKRVSGLKPGTKALARGTKLKSKRSTGNPTKGQATRFSIIVEIGCICCLLQHRRREVQVHHLTIGGKHGQKRRGHDYTIGLCPWHHDGQPPDGQTIAQALAELGPSYKHHARAFRALYGDDDALLARQNDLIKEHRCVVS